ncbi:MAG: hypothetical protein M3238_04040 [Actinomycetota bacterium]|nr:hypothetical protein [Actinomycetota bacterium]
MSFDRRLIRELRRLDQHDLRRVLIFVRGLLQAQGDDFGSGSEVDPEAGVTYRLESVRCGKPTCRSCPHGPYWYAYYREGNRLKSRYIGRDLPADVKELGRS